MDKQIITPKQLADFQRHLVSQERSPGTVRKYLADLESFVRWLGGRPITREEATAWKAHLTARGYAPVTVNAKLAALNTFLRFAGWEDCRLRFLKIQRRMFRDQSRDLTRAEYEKLVAAARDRGREDLALLLETICATGIRVSEVRYITREAVWAGRADIALKGKIRTILLPGKLCRKLKKFAQNKKIASGELFLTGSGRPMTRQQIWAAMKALGRTAGVEATKVFPHNLRHLFAAAFYRACRDVVRLADVLGHSSIETTRIYLLTTGQEHRRQLDRLGLV